VAEETPNPGRQIPRAMRSYMLAAKPDLRSDAPAGDAIPAPG
jgi:hypothetical protein